MEGKSVESASQGSTTHASSTIVSVTKQESKTGEDVKKLRPSRYSMRASRSHSVQGGHRQWRAHGGKGYKEPKFQNSFRMEPYHPFPNNGADKVLAKVLAKVEGMTYHPDITTLVRNLAADIRDQLFRTHYDRVKYVTLVSIIEKKEQSVDTKQGCLWDPARDTYSVQVVENETFWCIGYVYAVYYE